MDDQYKMFCIINLRYIAEYLWPKSSSRIYTSSLEKALILTNFHIFLGKLETFLRNIFLYYVQLTRLFVQLFHRDNKEIFIRNPQKIQQMLTELIFIKSKIRIWLQIKNEWIRWRWEIFRLLDQIFSFFDQKTIWSNIKVI